jgi:glycosyltransferase involved in cell wall biosynthesis
MLQKSDIICVGLPAWEGEYMKSTVQLMSEMTHFYRVFYVEYTYTINDVLKGVFKKNHTPIKRILGIENRLRKLELANGNEIFVLTLPPLLPINWIENKRIYQFFLKCNTQLILAAIRVMMKKNKIDNPLIINAFQPNYGLSLKGKLNEKATIYYCYDEISEAAWCKKHGTWAEEKFMKMVDAVVVSSQSLLMTKKAVQTNTFLVKNGVDTSIFSRFKKNINEPKTTIGYVGSINDRLDVGLIENLLEQFPKCKFLFVGIIIEKGIVNILKQYKNIEFTGPKQPDELADYMKKIDIGIIPFKKNEFTKNIYPLKINEYLASGMPVVSTDFADLSDFEGLIYESSPEDFGLNLALAIDEKHEELIEKRIAFARQNSWKNRAIEMNKIINTYFCIEKQMPMWKRAVDFNFN